MTPENRSKIRRGPTERALPARADGFLMVTVLLAAAAVGWLGWEACLAFGNAGRTTVGPVTVRPGFPWRLVVPAAVATGTVGLLAGGWLAALRSSRRRRAELAEKDARLINQAEKLTGLTRSLDSRLAEQELSVEQARRQAALVKKQFDTSEQQYRMLIERLNEGIGWLDHNGRFTFVNNRLCRMLGYDEQDILGRSPGEFVDAANRAVFRRALETRRRGGREPYELVWTRKDGEKVNTLVSPQGIFGPAGEYQGSFAVITDITRQKQSELVLKKIMAELERSNRELEQFAYVASHDLQEPLRMVSSFVKLLERRYKGRLDDDADEFIRYAVEGAERMADLINGLLVYSRVGSRARPRHPVDTQAALQHALANLKEAIDESGAVVTSDGLPTVSADGTQIVQLFQNLVGNALKFRGEQPPRVHVSAERRDGEWRFAVSDNGVGIAPKHAEKIFLIFQRLHHRDAYPGTGIGLAVSKKIVERHGGRIWVDSAPGRGATFYFTLPAENEGGDRS